MVYINVKDKYEYMEFTAAASKLGIKGEGSFINVGGIKKPFVVVVNDQETHWVRLNSLPTEMIATSVNEWIEYKNKTKSNKVCEYERLKSII